MKYAFAAAAIVAGVAAAPGATTDDWETWTSTTTKSTTTSTYWETWTTPSATTWATWTPTTKPAEWTTWAPTTTKCSSVSTYTTKECGANSAAWDNCKDVTKYSTYYPETCTWGSWTTPAASWSAVPVSYKCSTTSVYTTKECGDNSAAWDNCKDYTKTTTVYPTVCPTTWSEVYVTPVKATETWAPVYSSKVPVAASSSVWAPVAKFTGAANKETFGMGALAIAAVAAML